MKKVKIPAILLLSSIVFYTAMAQHPSKAKSGKVKIGKPKANADVVGSGFWMTRSDESLLLAKQPGNLVFDTISNANPIIEINNAQKFQQIDGFGFTLTGGSASLINSLPVKDHKDLVKELFSINNNGIGISYLRVSIGASDLNENVFSYDDLPAGQTDPNLVHFTLTQDIADLIPLLKEILVINPRIKILGSPWSAPTWMKSNDSSKGGGLLPKYYDAYANYFVKYIQAMKAKGITIDAITVQNEPQHGGNNPSMVMSSKEQAAFVKNSLGPAFKKANLKTKIIIWDHNCDNPTYPIDILNDPAAKAFVDGSAFHLYNGDISALSQVHDAHPDRNLYFTEQYTSSTSAFGKNLQWHLRNVIIGSMRNWSKNALEWNLANDAAFNPHTPGGCTTCKGAITIDGKTVTRNVGYYIIAHASKFVPQGSVRIGSNVVGDLHNVAFVRPDGKKVLIVMNGGHTAQAFNIKNGNKWTSVTIDGDSAATFVF